MGARFHADIHVPSTVAADAARSDGTLTGGLLLFDPNGSAVLVTRLRLSTDIGMRLVVGMSDMDSQRLMGGYFAGNGGAAPDVCWEGPAGGKVMLFRGGTGNVDVAIDGEYLP